MKTLVLILIFSIGTNHIFSQTDWSNINFSEQYKASGKVSKKNIKSLKSGDVFVNKYVIGQATIMKGSEASSTKYIYAQASLTGLNQNDYQQMVDDLYQEFLQELHKYGVKTTDGAEIMKLPSVQNKLKKQKKNQHIGSTGNHPAYEGNNFVLQPVDQSFYPVSYVKNDVSFLPRNINVFYSDSRTTSYLFLKKLIEKDKIPTISIRYNVSFAQFDSSKGYKSVELTTKPAMVVNASIYINGYHSGITYKKAIWAGNIWAKGMVKTKDNQDLSENLGLARSAGYSIQVNSDQYLAELRSIISNFQKDIVKHITGFHP